MARGRPKVEISLTNEEREELVRLARRVRTNPSLAYASWLNLVERFFALLSEEALKRGSHTSIPQLRRAILEYVEVHNEEGKPFVWTKTADEILDKVAEFGRRTLQVHGEKL